MSVLCVASDRFDPDPCAAALRAAGLTVEVVDDIAAGLWVVAGGTCRVVVMELTDEGGRWELVEAALWQRPPARVIALAAAIDPGMRRRAYEAGVWELGRLPAGSGSRVPATLLASIKEAVGDRRGGGQVLMVDDCRDVRDGIGAIVQDAGYRVDMASSASDAARRMRSGGYDLVLTEVRKAGPDGFQVIRDAARLQPGVPVVVLTAALDDASFMKCVELGASGCIWKLTEPEEILALIRDALAAGAPPRTPRS